VPEASRSPVVHHSIKVTVGGAYELSADDQQILSMHFSGAAPASYLKAQQKADNLNLRTHHNNAASASL